MCSLSRPMPLLWASVKPDFRQSGDAGQSASRRDALVRCQRQPSSPKKYLRATGTDINGLGSS